MSKEIFSKSYIKKKAEFCKISIKFEELKDDVVAEFLKCISLDYVKSLHQTVEKEGIDLYKNFFKQFNDNLNKGELTGDDLEFFEQMTGIYGDRLTECKLVEDYSSEVE